MGNTLDILFGVKFDIALDFSNFIDILGIAVNSVLAVWIVRTIQKKLTDKRVLKDHFISEVKDLRTDYDEFIKSLSSGTVLPKDGLRWFKSTNIKKRRMLQYLANLYKIQCSDLNNFHREFTELITNSNEFVANYRNNTPVDFSSATLRALDRIQLRYVGMFNSLIVAINDAN